jgi:hypothetical protein
MNTDERRLILDRGFERAIETVLSAFLSEGFSVKPLDAGDLHHRERPSTCSGHTDGSLRFALLEATLPELSFAALPGDVPALLGCRLTLFELTGSCTLLTADNPLRKYPLLASSVPRIADRVSRALRTVIGTGVLTAA